MKTYRKTAMLAFLLCVITVFVSACSGGNTPADSSAEESAAVETEAVVINEAALTVDGNVNFRIVRAEDASDTEIEAAKKLRTTLLLTYPDATINLVSDLTATDYDEESVEILVGLTSYPETQKVLDSMKYGDAVIQAVGHKIVFVSYSEVAYTSLANKFLAFVTAASDKNNLVFKDSDRISVTVNESLNSIPVLSGISPSNVVACGSMTYQLYFNKASAENLENYVSELKKAGFELKSDRTVASNRFTVLLNSDTAITAYFTSYNSTLRLIAEPASNYCSTENNTYTAVTTPILTMIGRQYTNNNTYLGQDANSGLMCFMIRLSDGRFIVIDGGTYGAVQSYATALYAKMLEQAPDKDNITIAAWIITHSHSDHVGGFKEFISTYMSKVKLESIMYNFPSDNDFKSSCDEKYSAYTNFLSTITTYCSKVPVYKIHTGQQYNIADALIEVYYTHEDYVTKTRTLADTTNWNNTSCIFSIDIAGERIMFLGDAQEVPNNLTAQIYGSYLKSDIVQVAHHGGEGGTRAIYNAIDPEIALFTTSDALISTYINKYDYDYHLVANLHVKEYFNSATRITTFDLPYHAKSTGFVKTTKN